MSDRVSQTIVLCEDEAHQRLTKAFLKGCNLASDSPMVKWLVASQQQQGGNDAWVLDRFPKELRACRQRNKKAKSLLVVLIDADNYSVEERRSQLDERAKASDLAESMNDDPVIVLIPKRHVETWIRVLLGETVTETEDCKSWKPPERDSYRKAAHTLYEWSRPNAKPSPTCVDSLRKALPQWHRIG